MADDEQFSLCWNNFNTNLSAGFHELLCREDLVDVTLAAEGQFVKAHRLVLSVCSPYFRKMFTQMPANQHAFVFLKDVSHSALKDLIQFMYCGEVNVKQEALPAFISTAEALQIKGLTDSDPAPSQSPAEPSTPTPQPQQTTQIQQITQPRVRQRPAASRTQYKLESIDDSDKQQPTQIVIQTTTVPQASLAQQTQHLQTVTQTQHHVPAQISTTTAAVSHKRPAQRSSSGPSQHQKRTKSTIDPLDVNESAAPSSQQITVQTAVVASDSKQSEPEYIDLPIDLPTKSEPDYTEEAGGDADSAEHDGAYVEDDSYGEMRYDESYFTENDDGNNTASGGGQTGAASSSSKAIVKQQQQSFSDSSYVDASDPNNTEAQAASVTLSPTASSKSSASLKEEKQKVRLHPKSKIFVEKDALANIFENAPSPQKYAYRLCNVVFGKQTMKAAQRASIKERSKLLQGHALDSIITHVIQVFTLRGEKLDRQKVLDSINQELNSLPDNQSETK